MPGQGQYSRFYLHARTGPIFYILPTCQGRANILYFAYIPVQGQYSIFCLYSIGHGQYRANIIFYNLPRYSVGQYRANIQFFPFRHIFKLRVAVIQPSILCLPLIEAEVNFQGISTSFH
jgi:hypothetical protein